MTRPAAGLLDTSVWIAATARAHQLPLFSQDAGFTALAELGLLEVVRV